MKKIPLNEFMKRQQTKKTRTVLAPFLDDILTLKKEGYTEAVILKYLAENGVTTSQQNLNRFIRRQMKLRAAAEDGSATKAEPVSQAAKIPQTSKPTMPPSSSDNAEKGKFKWPPEINKEEIY